MWLFSSEMICTILGSDGRAQSVPSPVLWLKDSKSCSTNRSWALNKESIFLSMSYSPRNDIHTFKLISRELSPSRYSSLESRKSPSGCVRIVIYGGIILWMEAILVAGCRQRLSLCGGNWRMTKVLMVLLQLITSTERSATRAFVWFFIGI